MSYHRKKIKYKEVGPYASTVERTLYVEESNSTDYIHVYQDDLYGHGGEEIIGFPVNDGANNFWEKLKSIIDTAYHENNEVEDWEPEDYKLIHPDR